MFIYFNSREQARKASFGKMVDFGPEANKGQRFARKLSGISGNAHQRKIAIKRVMRGM